MMQHQLILKQLTQPFYLNPLQIFTASIKNVYLYMSLLIV